MPMEMWRQAGVTGLDLTAEVQPISVTLGYLKCVLGTQDPSVVMVELYMFGQEASFDLTEAHNSMDHMPSGLTRTGTTLRSVEPTAWADVLLPLNMYHSRWSELTVRDFLPGKNSNVAYARGAMYFSRAEPVSEQVAYSGMREEAYQRDIACIREMARLCEAKGTRLVLFTSPSRWRPGIGDQLLLTRLEADLGTVFPSVSYLDMNTVAQDIGVDYKTDYGDELHVNHRGAVKLSRWLAGHLTREYGVADHRGDAIASRWNAALRKYDEVFVADW
jgi:hypothetical protein